MFRLVMSQVYEACTGAADEAALRSPIRLDIRRALDAVNKYSVFVVPKKQAHIQLKFGNAPSKHYSAPRPDG